MPQESRCSPWEISSHLNAISGTLLDHIDLHVEVPALRFQDIAGAGTGEISTEIQARVMAPRERQLRWFKGRRVSCNERMGSRELEHYCRTAMDAASSLIWRRLP